MKTISRLYDSYADAQAAVAQLERAGLPNTEISIVASNADDWYSDNTSGRARTVDRDRDGVDDRGEAASTGAAVGASIGGAAGLLAGLGLLAIPGLGPVVAAGWLASTALGAVAGGATGGIIGGLTEAGVSEEDAHVYAEGIRRGGAMVTVRVPDRDYRRFESLLDSNAVNIGERRKAYQSSGWNQFDPDAPPFTSDQVRSERDRFRASV